MSRIGKKPIEIPKGTEVTISDGFIVVKGKEGELRQKMSNKIAVEIVDNEVRTSKVDESREAGLMWGTITSLISNMIMCYGMVSFLYHILQYCSARLAPPPPLPFPYNTLYLDKPSSTQVTHSFNSTST